MNFPYKHIEVYTTEPSRIVYRDDTIKTVKNKANLTVERKREPLSIVAITDSITKSIDVKSVPQFFI